MVGDIFYAPFPFTDLSQAKVRPVLVLADVRSPGQDDWIVCEVSSSHSLPLRAMPIAPADFASGGLPARSFIRPDRLTVLNASEFRRLRGHLTDTKLAEVLAAVRALF